MKLSDLTPNEHNPRTITDEKLSMLKKALAEFGDLSGIIFNRKTKQLVGGHQRIKILQELPRLPSVVVQTTHSKPTKTGTMAEGYVEVKGERFAYREVYWSAHKEKAANIAANKGAGEWDMEQLNEWLKELSDFDLNFDLDLTMFDTSELAAMPDSIEVSAHTRKKKGDDEEDEQEQPPAKCKTGQVYKLGDSYLKVGSDCHYCDLIISRWEKYSKEEATLQTETKTKKRPQHAESHV